MKRMMRRNKSMIHCIITGLDWEEDYETFSEAIREPEKKEEDPYDIDAARKASLGKSQGE